MAVVVPSFHRAGPLRNAISDIQRQLRPGDELLVVDQSPMPPELPDVRVLRQDKPGLPEARNRGIAETGAPIVLFFDDDVRLRPGCLDAHRAAYVDPNVGGVVGRIIEHQVRPNSRTVANRVSLTGRVVTNLDGTGRRRIHTLKGANMSFRRAALAQAGGFDPNYRGTAFLEDADLSVRVAACGWELWFEPAAVVEHLSAPFGGVRQGDDQQAEMWRFHNTGYFVGLHGHPRLAAATFSAIALKRSLEWRRPTLGLMRAFRQGLALARQSPSPARSSR